MNMSRVPLPDRLTVPQAAALIARGLDAAHDRLDEHLARIALHIEYRNDPATLDALAGDPPLRPRLLLAAETLLSRIGVAEAGLHAPDLVTLIDSLLMQRTVYAANVNSESIIRAYLSGIECTEASD